jgi:hypothetical protein
MKLTAIVMAVVFLAGCDIPTSPSLKSHSTVSGSDLSSLIGVWSGSMTDWVGTAPATLTVAQGSSSLAYQYTKPESGVADVAFYNVTDGGRVGFLSTEALDVSFAFGSGRPECWHGRFQGSVQSVDQCTKQLSGSYTMQGTSDDCFSPPRTGTFTLRLNSCQ